ncbi:glycosyltransferase family 2 protein [Syntrophorhabdus aromaticivorans]|jgi:glycosyltransferase involved in cell wall biosynthesis|uniref:Glycosyltransferase family 2 protein n=1 Tax=Syntrophorhabdus aromaticivorans TaxID=328301 RepID=A0A351U2J5_9BACT|nr:glycosyltransferase family 2 protein [Syntrophorhabdus aromaticivorans]NLW35093.1 glycosyltransferase family 2 protein [Syntrophorhabdus aromaticivorans]HBA54176.1 glycosyltransferase family 2 protein [Syntrophorhabdus aromaticivorans]
MANRWKCLVIIPAFNEEGSVGQVVENVRSHLPQSDILVINDGSKDRTSEKARTCGAKVLDLPFNLGIGGAMQTGYKYAHMKGYDIAIQVDGDGQHDPKEIEKLLDALEERNLDMAIGSRFLERSEYPVSRARRIGIVILSRVISMIVGYEVTDPTSGFRAVNRRVIRLFSADYPQDYPEPEAIVFLHRHGLHIGEVPVGMTARCTGESSITWPRSIYYMVKVLLAIFVDCFKRGSPPKE